MSLQHWNFGISFPKSSFQRLISSFKKQIQGVLHGTGCLFKNRVPLVILSAGIRPDVTEEVWGTRMSITLKALNSSGLQILVKHANVFQSYRPSSRQVQNGSPATSFQDLHPVTISVEITWSSKKISHLNTWNYIYTQYQDRSKTRTASSSLKWTEFTSSVTYNYGREGNQVTIKTKILHSFQYINAWYF